MTLLPAHSLTLSCRSTFNEYAAKPSAARPFADICRHVDLPAEGMNVELAKGNTSATAALQTSELVAAGGGNYDADPLELSVQTAEAWQLVSRQAIERGRVTEHVVMGDMLDQIGALMDSTLITQTTTGLFDSRHANYLRQRLADRGGALPVYSPGCVEGISGAA